MNKKRICAILFVLICLAVFVLGINLNDQYFYAIMHESTALYQIRQFFALLCLYLMGTLFVHTIWGDLDPVRKILFAFPTGLCLWFLVGYVYLLCGIPFTLPSVFCGMAVLLGLALWRKKGKVSLDLMRWDRHLAMIGLMLLCSSGLLYVLANYDSYFYFINYGHALSRFGSFAAIAGKNSFTLTNISQFLPLICAYTSLWGLDQPYQIQAFLSVHVILVFFFLCYTVARKQATRQAFALSLLLTAFLATSTAYFVTSSWFLANMFCMAFMFLLFAVVMIAEESGTYSPGLLILAASYLGALAMLRKDGVIFGAFLIVWMCTRESFPKRTIAAIFLPACLLEISWLAYVRLFIDARVQTGALSSIANNKNILLILAIIVGCYLYILIGHGIVKKLCAKTRFLDEIVLIYIGLAGLLGALYFMKGYLIVDNLKYAMRNLYLYPSSWGISAIFYAIVLAAVLAIRPTARNPHFIWIGYAWLNFMSYCMVDSKEFWLNWDDSFNRVLMQIIPILLFVLAQELIPFLTQRTERIKPQRFLDRTIYAIVVILTVVSFAVVDNEPYRLLNDSPAYLDYTLSGGDAIFPLYPLFLQTFRLVFGESLFLYAVMLFQCAFSLFTIVYFIRYLHRTFHLHSWELILIWSATILPFAKQIPEYMMPRVIVTEAFTYPLFYFYAILVYEEVLGPSLKRLLRVYAMALLMSLIRPQMLLLFGISGLVLVAHFVIKAQRAKALALIGSAIAALFLCVAGLGLCYQLRVLYVDKLVPILTPASPEGAETDAADVEAVPSASIEYAEPAYRPNSLASKVPAQMISANIGRCFFEAEKNDAGSFADIDERNVFMQIYETCSERELLYDNPDNKFTMKERMPQNRIYEVAGSTVTSYLNEKYPDYPPQFHQARSNEILIHIALKMIELHPERFFKHLWEVVSAGMIACVFFNIWSIHWLCELIAIFAYTSAIAMIIWTLKKRPQHRNEAIFLLLSVCSCFLFVFGTNLVFYGLQRYVIYNMGIFYCTYYLVLRNIALDLIGVRISKW